MVCQIIWHSNYFKNISPSQNSVTLKTFKHWYIIFPVSLFRNHLYLPPSPYLSPLFSAHTFFSFGFSTILPAQHTRSCFSLFFSIRCLIIICSENLTFSNKFPTFCSPGIQSMLFHTPVRKLSFNAFRSICTRHSEIPVFVVTFLNNTPLST